MLAAEGISPIAKYELSDNSQYATPEGMSKFTDWIAWSLFILQAIGECLAIASGIYEIRLVTELKSDEIEAGFIGNG